jgi:aminomethyltransferase
LRLLVLPDAVLLLTPSITRAKLLRTLGVLVASTDVVVTDLTGDMVLLSVQGPQADRVCADALGLAPFDLPVFGGMRVSTPAHGDVTLVRSPRSGELGLDLLIGSENATAAFRAILDAVRAADGAPAGLRALDSLRIETGIVAYGADVDENTTPHETDLLDGMVSFDKGCFLGQDAVAATQFHGSPERKLRGIAFRSAVSPVVGDRVLLGDEEVGRITSACYAPSLGHAVAMALLAYPQVKRRSAVRIADGEIGIVTHLPFRRV